jgi:hypothetical protein
MGSSERNGATGPAAAAPASEVGSGSDTQKRYLVTVERELVVYARDSETAQVQAMHYLRRYSLEQPADRPYKVVEVSELPSPEEEPHGETIDRAPSRETRS